ncbi:hypothetical protein NDU88_005320 [Pleurodeles waltl]|uniref:Secreted protein n=1 Tax=Pleurodeles waltl TaxID=8319 RepID=A0AAV7LRT7_PLEWA|nr:hypothetical protein NDU88_005320 [Pleurodeles waltl]
MFYAGAASPVSHSGRVCPTWAWPRVFFILGVLVCPPGPPPTVVVAQSSASNCCAIWAPWAPLCTSAARPRRVPDSRGAFPSAPCQESNTQHSPCWGASDLGTCRCSWQVSSVSSASSVPGSLILPRVGARLNFSPRLPSAGQAAGSSRRQRNQDPHSRVRNGFRGSPARPLRLPPQCNRGLPRGKAPGSRINCRPLRSKRIKRAPSLVARPRPPCYNVS